MAGHVAHEIRAARGSPPSLRVRVLDDIQYLADGERHVKVFVGARPNVECVVSGSATPALSLKGMESGARRSTDFELPPLPFLEFLNLPDIDRLVEHEADNGYRLIDIAEANRDFIDHPDLGGYPALISPPTSRSDFIRHACAEIVDNVPFPNIPSLCKPVEIVCRLARPTVSVVDTSPNGGIPAFRGRNSPCWGRIDIQRRPSTLLSTLLQQVPRSGSDTSGERAEWVPGARW